MYNITGLSIYTLNIVLYTLPPPCPMGSHPPPVQPPERIPLTGGSIPDRHVVSLQFENIL